MLSVFSNISVKTFLRVSASYKFVKLMIYLKILTSRIVIENHVVAMSTKSLSKREVICGICNVSFSNKFNLDTYSKCVQGSIT